MRHQFHNDIAAVRFEAKKANIEAAMYAPVSIEPEKAKQLYEDLKSGDKAKIDEVGVFLKGMLSTGGDALSGRFNAATERNKMVNQSVMPMAGKVIEVYMNQYGDDLEAMDMTWLSYITTDDVTTAFRATIYDVILGIKAYKLDSDTSPIPSSSFKASTWEDVRPEFYGTHVPISRTILELDPMTSINLVVIGMRIALMKMRVQVAFERIQAGIDAAITAGYTTAYTGSSVAKTLNAGYLTLIQRLRTKGYGLTAQTPVTLTCSESLRDVVEPVFEITVNSLIASGNANGTIITRYPMTRQYTFNLASDLGASGTKVALILGQRRMRMANFRNAVIEGATDVAHNAQSMYGREAYNFLIDEEQIQICTIA